MLDEAKELLVRLGDEFAPTETWWRDRAAWLARYEQRKEMVVEVLEADEAMLPYSWLARVGAHSFISNEFWETRQLTIADARRVADELGLRMKVEGE